MNGQFPSPAAACGHSGNFLDRHRLGSALVMSCVLHLSLLAAAYLGETARENPPLAKQGQKHPHSFTASLTVAPPTRSEALQEIGSPLERTEGIGMLPLPAPTYYPTDQLTKRPQPLGAADLDVPEIRMIVASGKMILKLWIDEFGEVVDVDVEKTELPDVLSRPTVAAFKRLRFTPGERNGLRVGSVMRIEVSYDDARVAGP